MFSVKKQQIAIFILAVVLVVDFIFFGYIPLRRQSKVIKQALAAQEMVISSASVQKEQVKVAKEKLEQMQRDIANYQANLPEHRNLGEFLQQITELMDKCGLKDQHIQPGQEIASEKLNGIPVVIQCKGSLKQLFEFYKNLQSMDRLVRIERIELINDKDYKGLVSMRTNTIIYYRPTK